MALIGWLPRYQKGARPMEKAHSARFRRTLARGMACAVVLGLTALTPRMSVAHDNDRDDRDDDDDNRSRPAVRPPDGQRVRPQPPERELRKIVREIDKRRIEKTIRTLVG